MSTTDRTELPPAPRTRRRKSLVLALLAVTLILVIVGVCAFVILTGNEDLKQALAEADRLDPDWRLADLDARRASIPDAENSALQVQEAAPLIPQPWPDWPMPLGVGKHSGYGNVVRKTYLNGFSELGSAVQLNETQIKALQQELGRAEQAVQEARKLAGLPRGRNAVTLAQDIFGTRLPHLQQVNELVGLLKYDAYLRAQDRDLHGAWISWHALLNAERSIGDEYFSISQLTRCTNRTAACRCLERIMAQGELSEAALAAAQQMLAEEAEEPLLLYASRGERAAFDTFMEKIQYGELTYTELSTILHQVAAKTHAFVADDTQILSWQYSARLQRAAFLRYMNELVEAAKLPYYERKPKLQTLEQVLQSDEPPLMIRILSPVLLKTSEAEARSCAELRSGVIALAAERYRKAVGQWPASLDALVPKYLPKIPLDPFDGQPLRLARRAQGLVIYSVGSAGVDRSGQLNPNASGMDLGFQLWDVPHRRQPAKPFVLPPDSGASEGKPR